MVKNRKYVDVMTALEMVILRCFFPEGDSMTLKKIQDRSGYSYERVNSGLKILEEKKIVSSKNVGKTLLYDLNFDSAEAYVSFVGYMHSRLKEFRENHVIVYNALKNASKNIFGFIILFGSFSKGLETKGSDIDLMIVSDKKSDFLELENLKSRYGLNFSPVSVKRKEFLKIKDENFELWKDLKYYALVFNEEGVFYRNFY